MTKRLGRPHVGLALAFALAWGGCGSDDRPAAADAAVDTIADVDDTTGDSAQDGAEPADSAEVADSAEPADSVSADTAAADTVTVDTVVPPPLGDEDGLAVWVSGLALGEGASASRAVWLEAEVGGDRFPLGADPATPPLWRVPPQDVGPPVLARIALWTLAPGVPVALAGDAWLVTRAADVRALDFTLRAFERAVDGADTLLAAAEVHLASGEGPSVRQVMAADAPVRVWIGASAGVPRLPAKSAVGLLLDSSRPGLTEPVAAFVGALAGRTVRLKAYHGSRPYLLRPGCFSDVQCTPGGESYPCVSTCACHCTAQSCDCDLSGLEADMRSRAIGTAARVLGADTTSAAFRTARVHYVFKRSLGGTSSCDANGEVDVDPATYAAFFRAALEAAHRINIALGFLLIDAVSPQNESNHPLQDGMHRNAAGMMALGGDAIGIPYVDLLEQQSCDAAGHCCTKDRYLVADPDTPALLAASLVAGRQWRDEALAGPDADLAPEVGMSLYLDSDQTDPLATDDDGAHPAIVTPVPQFLDQLASALAVTPGGSADVAAWASDLLFVDTYPGSWAEPWFITEDEIVHHYDPDTLAAMRYEATRAADAVTVRTRAAADAFEAKFAVRPQYVLGEVGWATLDLDEAAQARFARRLFMRAAELAADDPRFGGFIWFKDTDVLVRSYPRWVDGADPITGTIRPCDTWFLSRVACAADVLVGMEGQWGLFSFDGTRFAPKPGWAAWSEAFLAWVPAPAPPPPLTRE